MNNYAVQVNNMLTLILCINKFLKDKDCFVSNLNAMKYNNELLFDNRLDK